MEEQSLWDIYTKVNHNVRLNVCAPIKRAENDFYFKGLLDWLSKGKMFKLLLEDIRTVFKTNFLIVKVCLMFIYPKSTLLCSRKN